MNKTYHLVLLPGLDGTGNLFEPIIPFLENTCDVTVIRYTNQKTFDEHVSHVEKQLEGKANISLVAESFSGPVAIALLARNKFDFQPSVLCATFSKAPFQFLTGMAKHLPDTFFDMDFINKLALDVFGIDKHTPTEVRTNVLEALKSVEPNTIKNRIKILNETNVSHLAPEIDTPMLYLQATRDRIISRASEKRLIENIPNITSTKVDGPHLLLQSKPEECARLIFEHITSTC